MTVTHDFNSDATASDAAIGEAISIEPGNALQEVTPPSDTESSLMDMATIYVVMQVHDKEKIRNLIQNLNSDPAAFVPAIGEAIDLELEDPAAFVPAIGEAIDLELEDTAQEIAPPSEVADFSPMEMATSVAQQVLNIANGQRRRARVSPLRLHSRLMAAAQAHSKDMARHLFMSHNSSDGTPFGRRITRYYKGAAAENVAYGQTSSQDVMRSWMNSTGHRRNILKPNFRYMGIGYARGRNNRLYWAQTFGG